MTDMVTGTPAIVGFTNGSDRGYDYGWNSKDTMYARSVDAGEQTRDIMKDVRDNALYLREAISSNAIAIEKTGAAGILESAKNAAALHVQIANNAAAAAATAAANQQAAMMYANTNQSILAAQIAACCCELKELNVGIESARVRDQLALLQTQFMMVTGGLSPAGKAA